jgi:hypothetical protein
LKPGALNTFKNMKLTSYQGNCILVNQNTNPERHGVSGNDGLLMCNPPEVRNKVMAEHAALVLVEAALQKISDGNTMESSGKVQYNEIDVIQEHYKIARIALANLTAVRANEATKPNLPAPTFPHGRW